MDFLSALAAIVVIDLVLAGDNAIVIALAARGVPASMRKRVILWGTIGAIAVRSTLTVLVVWLLKIPGLMLGGGALLLWIAYRLLIPDDESGHGEASGGTSFLSAMRTIIIADTVMGLDNVLAVAGAAHGSYLLVGLGLAISIPIVIWGSTLVLSFVERHPWTVYAGAGVLAFTAVKMIAADSWLNSHVEITPRMAMLLHLLLVPGVLWVGFVRNHRRLESRVHARLAGFEGRRLSEITGTQQLTEGDVTMRRVLIPVDGTANADTAVRHVLNQFMADTSIEIHLLNVQTPLSRHVGRFVRQRDSSAWHREQADRELAPAREVLERHRVPFVAHTAVGERAAEIAGAARRLRCEHIVMGTARKRSITRMFEDSVTDRVLDLTDIPVELVAGAAVSRLERFGVPAGIGAALALLFIAGD